MTQPQPVRRVSALSPLEFERTCRGIRPVVIEGGARELPAFARWDRDYLERQAGAATVDVSHYRAGPGDYDDIRHERTTLRAFIDALSRSGDDAISYLFPNPSCVFARNEVRSELHTGWATTVNPGLAPLAHDFSLPEFVRPDDYVLASLIMGSSKNATDLHYDWGGESKLLVQLRGRKLITLMAPGAAPALELHSAFGDDATAAPKERNPTRGAAPRGAALTARVAPHTLTAELAAGDLIYWPGFWFHEVKNFDDQSLAISVFLDENQLNPLLVRHMLFHTFNAFTQLMHTHLEDAPLSHADVAGMDISFKDLPFIGLLDLFREYEAFLLSDNCAATRSLWAWNNTRVSRR